MAGGNASWRQKQEESSLPTTPSHLIIVTVQVICQKESTMGFTQALLCSLSSVCPTSRVAPQHPRIQEVHLVLLLPLLQDGEMKPSCSSVPQFTWGEQAHLAPRSSLEPHGAWSIPKHPSGAPQSLEHPRRQSNLGSGDPRYRGILTEPPRIRSIPPTPGASLMPEHSSGARQSLQHPGAWSILSRCPREGAPSGLSGTGEVKGPGRGRVRPGCGVARGRGGGGAMAVAEAVEATVPCRVQYLEDADPFAFGSFPEPRRAPVYAVEEALALGAQLPALHRLLGAPLPVSGGGGGGESTVRAPCGGRAGRGCLEGTGGRGIGRCVPGSVPGVSHGGISAPLCTNCLGRPE